MNINSTWPVIKLSQSKMDIDDPAFSEVFNDIQGNILKSHGRTHSRHLFLQFKGDRNTNREWVSQLAQNLTSALEQHHTSLDYKKTGNEHLFTGFMLSYSGYKALGIDESKIPDDKAFRAGMKDTSFRYDTGPEGIHKRTVNPLNDNPDNWEFPFQQKIDALLILAYGGDNLDDKVSESYLDNKIKIIKDETHNVLSILTIEKGYVLRNEQGMVIEHFGFVDGLSNPVFFKSDYEKWEEEGTDAYDPSAPFGLVAVNDPNGENPDISFGSYFVYRKMQQNLKGFKNQSKEFASELSNSIGSRVEEEFAKALAFGRYEDGTPLVKNVKTMLNNFDYQNDMEGLKCPFHSHIRKTNPRGDTSRKSKVPLRNERSKRIVRRGISYGSKNLDPKEEWTDAGLLFLSCQSDIEQQFLVMQCGWSDNANFLNEGVGHDPITGDQNANTNEKNKSWNLEINGKKITTNFRYRDLVKVKGGEYFFAPSISFCKNLINNNT